MGARREKGQGSVSQLADGTWRCYVTLDDGRRRYRTAPTKKAALAHLAALRAERDSGRLAFTGQQTLSAFMADWLAECAHTKSRTTTAHYTRHWRLHIKPALGHKRLCDIRPAHVQSFVAELRRAGMAPGSVRTMYSVLRSVLNDAVRLEMLPSNPALAVRVPVVRQAQRDVPPMRDLIRLVTETQGERYHTLLLLLLATGMRKGEALGLRWSSIHWDDSSLTITHALHYTAADGFWLDRPKTRSSERTIGLPQHLMDALRTHRLRQAEDRLAAGPLWVDTDLVFARPNGEPIGTGMVNRELTALLARLGLPHMRVHDLRHAAITHLLAGGAAVRDVSAHVGHSSPMQTLTTYSHAISGAQSGVGRHMGELLDTALQEKTS